MFLRAASIAFLTLLCALRSTAAIIPVFTTNDAFAGSLRQAIQDAPPGSTILFQIPTSDPGYSSLSGSYTITLTSASLSFNKSLTIDGGNQKIIIQRSVGGGIPNFQIFQIAGGTVTLANLNITNGNASGTLASLGGGILNYGALTVRNCAIYNNQGGSAGGGISNPTQAGSLAISNCTITGNIAFQIGGIENSGTLVIDNSTVTGNGSQNPSTGGIRNNSSTTAHIRNTIVLGNTGSNATVASDVTGTWVSEGYNLIGSTNGSTGFGATGDQLGVPPASANLGSLQDNGGPTYSVRPGPGSLAIDQGNRGTDSNAQPINTDQRGYPRPVDLATPNAFAGDGSDIGAVETAGPQSGTSFTVTNNDFNNDGVCSVDDCTFSEALTAANANADANTISFASGVIGTIQSGNYSITSPVTINGPGARILTLNLNFAHGFAVSSANVIISGLTIRSGFAGNGNGGAISNSGGLTLLDCTIASSSASGTDPLGQGGAIYNAGGASLTMTRCTVSGCQAANFGGGIYSDGNVTATNCTFSGNTAVRGGGIISRFNNGAAIMTLRNCTITGNTATDGGAMAGFGGGGIYSEGGAQQHFLGNSIIAHNNSTNDPDLRGQYTSQGHNLIRIGGDSTGLTNGANGDIVGSVGSPMSAQFAAFGNNGGPTDTWSLLSNSPARNAGDDALAPLTDQRGYPRIGLSDIGAFEFSSGLLRVTNITRSGNDIAVDFAEAVAGSSYRLERKAQLSDASWQPINGLADFSPGATGTGTIAHPGGVNVSPGFYRVRLLP